MKTIKAYHISTQISDNTFFKHTSLAKGFLQKAMPYDMFKVWKTGGGMVE